MDAKKKFKLNSIKCTLFTFSIIIVFIYECIVLFTNKPFMYNEYKVISYKETLIKVNNNRAKFPYRTKINVEYLNEYKVKCSKTIEFSEKVDKNKNFILVKEKLSCPLLTSWSERAGKRSNTSPIPRF